MKKNFKKTVSLFLVGIILGISIMSVFAMNYVEVWSQEGYYGPQLGYYYMNQNWLTCWGDDNGMSSCTLAASKDGAEVIPAGYMGAQTWIYLDGDRIYVSPWEYSTEDDNYFFLFSDDYFYDEGYYYSDGRTKAFNSQGTYYTYESYSTPTIHYTIP